MQFFVLHPVLRSSDETSFEEAAPVHLALLRHDLDLDSIPHVINDDTRPDFRALSQARSSPDLRVTQ